MTEIRWTLDHLISDAGGQADVYQITRKSDGMRAAAKFPKAMHAHLPEVQERFNREASHYRRLHSRQPHRHIAQMIETVVWEDRQGIALELMKASFEERLRQGISDKEKMQAIREAAIGLAHLHRFGIAHRDMKPSNLLQAYDGRYVVADLGCATVEGAQAWNLTQASIGTPDLMAPEQHGPSYRADARSDVYGLGTCIAAAFLGQYPTKLPTDDKGGLRIVLGPNYEQIHPEFKELLRRCLHPDPDQRFPFMDAFLLAWGNLERRGLLVTAPKTPSKPSSPLEEIAKVAALGLGLAVVMVGLTALLKR